MKREQLVQIAYLLLRVVAGLLFLHAGNTKVLGWFPETLPPGTPPFVVGSQVWIGGLMEVIGGALIMVGLFTTPAAFLLAGEMAVAYFQFHQPGGTWPIQNHGVEAVLFCFIFLFMAAYGSGRYSLDSVIFKKKPAEPAS